MLSYVNANGYASGRKNHNKMKDAILRAMGRATRLALTQPIL